MKQDLIELLLGSVRRSSVYYHVLIVVDAVGFKKEGVQGGPWPYWKGNILRIQAAWLIADCVEVVLQAG